MNNEIVESFVEVESLDESSFLKVRETLSRIGIASRKENKLYQSCHVFHKQGKYYIVHFLEMFLLDGRGQALSEEDKGRRNTIINLLQEWGLIKIMNPAMVAEPRASMRGIKVIPYAEKKNWLLCSKYEIGSRH